MAEQIPDAIMKEVQEFLDSSLRVAKLHKYRTYLGDMQDLIREKDLFCQLYAGNNILHVVLDIIKDRRPDISGSQVFNELMALRNNDKIPRYNDPFSQKIDQGIKSSMPAFALLTGIVLPELLDMKAEKKGAEIAAEVKERGDYKTHSYGVLENILGVESREHGSKWRYTEYELRSKIEKIEKKIEKKEKTTEKEKRLIAIVGALAMLHDVKDLPLYEIRESIARVYDKKYGTKGRTRNIVREGGNVYSTKRTEESIMEEQLETLNTMDLGVILEVVYGGLEPLFRKILMPEVDSVAEIEAGRPVSAEPKTPEPPAKTPIEIKRGIIEFAKATVDEEEEPILTIPEEPAEVPLELLVKRVSKKVAFAGQELEIGFLETPEGLYSYIK